MFGIILHFRSFEKEQLRNGRDGSVRLKSSSSGAVVEIPEIILFHLVTHRETMVGSIELNDPLRINTATHPVAIVVPWSEPSCDNSVAVMWSIVQPTV